MENSDLRQRFDADVNPSVYADRRDGAERGDTTGSCEWSCNWDQFYLCVALCIYLRKEDGGKMYVDRPCRCYNVFASVRDNEGVVFSKRLGSDDISDSGCFGSCGDRRDFGR